MRHAIFQLIGFFQRLNKEPEDVRRRLAKILLWGALPVTLGLWWLTLHASVRERTASDMAKSAAPVGKGAAQDVVRGFANLKEVIGFLQKEIQDERERSSKSFPEAQSPQRERFTLPIVE